MAQLTAGRRLLASVVPAGGRLGLSKPGRAAALASFARAGVLVFPVPAGWAPEIGAARRGSVRFSLSAAGTWAGWPGRHGRQLFINRRPKWPAVSAPMAGNGPGSAAGEFVIPLPAVWISQAFPAGFVGRDLGALALLRGESSALVGSALVIGGRVLIGVDGTDVVFVDADDAEAWIGDRYDETARYLGVLGLPPGARRDAVISRYRRLAAVAVRSGAKYALGVGDDGRRAALLADLEWIERRI